MKSDDAGENMQVKKNGIDDSVTNNKKIIINSIEIYIVLFLSKLYILQKACKQARLPFTAQTRQEKP